MTTYTIGFTQKSASRFFSLLMEAEVRKLIDVRLNNVSQLAGFAKRDDLRFFLKAIGNVEYEHLPELAPTKDILDAYKKKQISWDAYEQQFVNLIEKRNIEKAVSPSELDGSCLLCSEHKPHHCHRRLIIDYLNRRWGASLDVVHLF
jgi:uncharacterized protein (DUF488 family)